VKGKNPNPLESRVAAVVKDDDPDPGASDGPQNVGKSGECNELEDLVNKERRGSGLRPLHCDPHMRWVANRHIDDAIEGAKKNLAWPKERGCNAHSWLVKFPCCYTGDHDNPDCMWDKPLELSGWDDRSGFEISVSSDSPDWTWTPAAALSQWKSSPLHYDVIMGRGIWSDLKTVGCALRNQYGHCWFSKKKI